MAQVTGVEGGGKHPLAKHLQTLHDFLQKHGETKCKPCS